MATYIQTHRDKEQGNLYSIVMSHIEQPLIRETLRRTRGNKRQAAELLGINRNTLRKKLRQHSLE